MKNSLIIVTFGLLLACVGQKDVQSPSANSPAKEPRSENRLNANQVELIFPPPVSSHRSTDGNTSVLIAAGENIQNIQVNGQNLELSNMSSGLWVGDIDLGVSVPSTPVTVTLKDGTQIRKTFEYAVSARHSYFYDIQHFRFDPYRRQIVFTRFGQHIIYRYDLESGTSEKFATLPDLVNGFNSQKISHGIPLEIDIDRDCIYIVSSKYKEQAPSDTPRRSQFFLRRFDLDEPDSTYIPIDLSEGGYDHTYVRHIAFDEKRDLVYLLDSSGQGSPIKAVDVDNWRLDSFLGWFGINSRSETGVIDGDLGYGDGFRFDQFNDRFVLTSAGFPNISELQTDFKLNENRGLMMAVDRSETSGMEAFKDSYLLFDFERHEMIDSKLDLHTPTNFALSADGNTAYLINLNSLWQLNIDNKELEPISAFPQYGTGPAIMTKIYSHIELDPHYPVAYLGTINGMMAINLLSGDRAEIISRLNND